MSMTTSQLTDEQISEYRENGFIGVNDVFSMEEVEELRRVTDEFVQQSAELTEHTEMFDLDFGLGIVVIRRSCVASIRRTGITRFMRRRCVRRVCSTSSSS